MGWGEFLFKSGTTAAFITGWAIYVYKWATSLKPENPLALGQKIYFEIEERFYNTILNRIFTVLDANVDSLQTYHENPLDVKHSLTSEIESILNVLSLARGQRTVLRRYALRRRIGLITVWLMLGLTALFLILSVEMNFTEASPTIKLTRSYLFYTALLTFILNLVTIWWVKRQSPLLDDTLSTLKAARDDLRQ
jgi:hypothetical protein